MADEEQNKVDDTTPEAGAEREATAPSPEAQPEPVTGAAEEPSGEAPAEQAEEAAREAVAEETAPEPAADEPAPEPAAEEPVPGPEAEEPEPAAEPAATPPAPKPKRKRLPRAERHKHVKPKRERPAKRRPIVRQPKPEYPRGRRQERRGVVVSSATDKTIVVKVDTVKAHPKYKKVVRRSTKFHAHDEENAAKIGDLVRIVETKPISRLKHWRLAEVLEEAK